MRKNIIFMGTPDYAVEILKELVMENFTIQAIFTQNDKKVGRKQILTPSAIKAYASMNLIETPIFTPRLLKDEGIVKQISNLKPDFIVVAAFGKILPKEILQIAPCINLHASLLPKYRGASPIQSAILNGDEKSGVCTMLMDEGLDTGAILESTECSIKGLNSAEVFELLAKKAAKLCVQTLKNFNAITPKAQDESLASYCVKIKKEDGLVNLDYARNLYQKFLAFTPWPGVFLENGLKFLELEFVDEKEHERAGEILKCEKESFLLACKKGTLRVKALQEPSKKALKAREFMNGKRLERGSYLY